MEGLVYVPGDGADGHCLQVPGVCSLEFSISAEEHVEYCNFPMEGPLEFVVPVSQDISVYLDELWVTRDRRRQRLGSALVRVFLRMFPNCSIHLLAQPPRIDDSLDDLLLFYESLGFEVEDVDMELNRAKCSIET